jgi:arylsulfatase A-like enzyme
MAVACEPRGPVLKSAAVALELGEPRARAGHARRSAVRWIAVLAALLPGCARTPAEPPANLLLYVVDTLRADALAPYGNPVVATPAASRLAAEGTLYERALAHSSWTRASMATLLSGLGAAAHGAQGRDDSLPAAIPLVSEALRDAGFATAAVVANPNVGSVFGFDRGFDEFIELYARREKGPVGVAELRTTADEVTRRAVEWLARAPRPFFLVVLTIDPHSPYRPPARHDRYGRGIASFVTGSSADLNRKDLTPADRERLRSLYLAEVAANDEALGALLAHLEAAGELDATAVILTSDHGEEFWEHAGRGHGHTLYDELLRVPLIVRYPARFAAGARVRERAQLVDVAPTLLELAGLPPDPRLPGRSLLAPDPQRPRPAHASLRLGPHRLDAVVVGEEKLVVDRARGREALYDLSDDPGETRDRAAERAERTAALRGELEVGLAAEARVAAELRGGQAAPIAPDALPPEVVQSLRELGYLDDAEAPPPDE